MFGSKEMTFAKNKSTTRCVPWLLGEEYFSNSEDPTVARWLAGCRRDSSSPDPWAIK